LPTLLIPALEAEAGDLRVPGHCGLNSEFLSQKATNQKRLLSPEILNRWKLEGEVGGSKNETKLLA
jgi:hypothetical protein